MKLRGAILTGAAAGLLLTAAGCGTAETERNRDQTRQEPLTGPETGMTSPSGSATGGGHSPAGAAQSNDPHRNDVKPEEERR